MKYVVISYDISDDKKRNKVANMLLDYGTRVQYSVFECLIDAKTLEKLVERPETPTRKKRQHKNIPNL
ncbi:MAG: CRISPR-associated endonuclease Cas2 [Methanosarcinales archaeon]|uniref:CRISPR-associated endoribonuclease Cas2 n=1 Tax=Candidatus Ethanoperedens thermophilum TaxID=2766897 RepID=A0A848D9H2_9EURY|nr:CRISPR-associated endonuclease Cas2 [Candidatus Ethanoperedens thermophilum]